MVFLWKTAAGAAVFVSCLFADAPAVLCVQQAGFAVCRGVAAFDAVEDEAFRMVGAKEFCLAFVRSEDDVEGKGGVCRVLQADVGDVKGLDAGVAEF